MNKKLCDMRVKAAGDRTFTFTISTNDVDRDNDIIDQSGWELDRYKANPVVLAFHAYDKPPIAKTIAIGVQGNALKATAQFVPKGIYGLADEIHDLVAAGFLNTTSVGFKPLDQSYDTTRGGMNIRRAELLEWSVVSVPSNPQAVITSRSACDRAAVQKWFQGKETPMRSYRKHREGCPLGPECTGVDSIDCPKMALCPFEANSGKPMPKDIVLYLIREETPEEILAKREQQRCERERVAEQLQKELAAFTQFYTQHGRQISLEYRSELREFFPESKCFWIQGKPIHTLGIA